MRKSVLSLLMTLVLCFAFLPISVSAEKGATDLTAQTESSKTQFLMETDESEQASLLDGTQKALWFMSAVYLSQAPGGGYSHQGTQNFDVVGYFDDYISAPFDCKVVQIHTGEAYGNTVIIESVNPVQYADGSVDYMSMAFAHDNDISDLYVGKTISQSYIFYQTGTYGYVTGKHSHVTCIRGRYQNDMWTRNAYGNYCSPNAISPRDALFRPDHVPVIDDKGLNLQSVSSSPNPVQISASWEIDSNRHQVGNTDATLAAILRVSGASISDVSRVGVYLYNSDGQEVASKGENISYNLAYLEMWYYVNSELGYTLTRNTGYYYRYFAVIRGETYYSDMFPIRTDAPTVSASGSTVTVLWKPIQGASHYDVYLVQAPWGWGDIKYSGSSSSTSYTFDNVAVGDYSAFVIARPNADNAQSGWSGVTVESPRYYLDLNAYLDGGEAGGLGNYGTADVYINGSLVADNVNDYYAAWPTGTSYEIKDIRPTNGYSYNGVHSGSRSGTIADGNAYIFLNLTKIDTNAITESPDSRRYNGHTYLFFTTPATWYTAKLICEARGGHLATISNVEENSAVQVLTGNRQAWIGGTDGDGEGTWRWVSGEVFSYTNWLDGQPDNYVYNDEGCENYLHLSDGGTWNDNAGYACLPFVCEIDSAEPEQYAVTYDANGGSGSMSNDTTTEDVAFTLPQNGFAPPNGKEFKSWSVNGANFQPGEAYVFTADTTVFAVWEDIVSTQIAVESKNASRGSAIDLSVTIKNNPGISGATLAVSYDKSVFTLNAITKGSVFETGNYSTYPETGVMLWYHTENITTDGTLFTLHFVVSHTATNGDYNISIGLRDGVPANLSNANSDIVNAEFIPGVITVASGIHGDVTGDGVVAINDVVKLARSVAGNITLSSQERELADVTGDGIVAINDVVKLARYVAGNIASLQNAEATLFSGNASAVIETASVRAEPGETVQVPVSITSNPGIAGAQLDILFDDNLTLKNIIRGDVLSVGTFNPDVSNGRIQWYYDQANVTDTGVLFMLEFDVSDSAESGNAYAVTVNVKDSVTANLSDYDFNIVNAEFKSGKVQIGEASDTIIEQVNRNGTTVTAEIVCADTGATAFCGIYNNRGQFVTVSSREISGASTYSFQFDGYQFDYAKVFLLDSSQRPLCESKRS